MITALDEIEYLDYVGPTFSEKNIGHGQNVPESNCALPRIQNLPLIIKTMIYHKIIHQF